MDTHRRSLWLAVVITPVLAVLLAWAAWRGGYHRFVWVGDDVPPGTAKEEAGERNTGAESPAAGVPLREHLPFIEVTPAAPGTHLVSGFVLDPSGEPAKGAEAILLNGAEEDLEDGLAVVARATTSPEGTFQISGTGPGPYRVAARLDGYLPAVSGPIAASDEGEPGPVELRLGAAASLRGSVVRADGSPVAGARLTAGAAAKPPEIRAPERRRFEELLQEKLARRSATGRSDASGRFEFSGLLGGYYDLTATADGFARSEVADAPTGDAALRIVLRPELFLRGEVVDSAEKPIAGAEVRATFLAAEAVDARAAFERKGDLPKAPSSRTGADGRFDLGGLAGGAYRVEIECAGYQRAVAPMITVGESAGGGDARLVFRLEPGHRLRGSVQSETGGPLPGALLRARFVRPLPPRDDDPRREIPAEEEGRPGDEPGAAGPPEASGRTRADGGFELAGLAAGIYRLEVTATSYRPKTIEDSPTDGEPISIELAPAAPLVVQVLDGRTGNGIAGASVTHRPAEEKEWPENPRVLRTDREGRVRLEDLPEGPQLIAVEAEGYRTRGVTTEEGGGEPELTISLERGGSVSGRVRSAGGSAVEGLRASLVQVEAAPAQGDPPWRESAPRRLKTEGRSGYTDVAGLYRIPLHEGGSYRIVVEGRPYVTAASAIVEIPDSEAEVKDIDLEVRLEAAVRGLVVDGVGLPVPGAQVQVIAVTETSGANAAGADPGGTPATLSGGAGGARADAVGAFEVSGLREGRFRLIAGAPGYSRASEVLDLRAGQTSAIQVVLEPEMAIAGAVVSREGDPVAAAEIRAAPRGEGAGESWREERTYSSTPGTFRLGKLANRRYDLRVTAAGFASALVEDVAAGSGAVEVRLERPVALAGRVMGAFTGDPAVEFRLGLEPEVEGRLSDREIQSILRPREVRDAGGAFSVDGLPPGRYSVHIEAPGHLDAGPLSLEVPAGEGLSGVEIPLPESGLLAGTVLDGQSRPVAGASVIALVRTADPVTGKLEYQPYWPAARPPSSRRPGKREKGDGEEGEKVAVEKGPPVYGNRLQTQDDGRFWLRGLPDGVYRLRIYHEDFVVAETGEHTVEEGSAGPTGIAVAVYLDSGTTLFGSVRWMSTVEGGDLSLDLSPERREAGAAANRGWLRKRAQADDRGHFQIRGLSPGDYLLTARYRRASDGSPASVRKRISIQDPVREKTIILDLGN